MLWLEAIGMSELLLHPKLHSSYLVCDRHFSTKQKFKAGISNKTSLLFDAVPDTSEYIKSVIICVQYAKNFL